MKNDQINGFSDADKALFTGTTSGLTLVDITSKAEGDNRAAILKALRKSAEFGRTVADAGNIIILTGPPEWRDETERILEFPLVYGGQKATRFWSHWNMGSLYVCDNPSQLHDPKHIATWAKMPWFSFAEAVGSVIGKFKCVAFDPRKSGKHEALPPFCFDDAGVKKITTDAEYTLFNMAWDEFEATEDLALKGQKGRIKRAVLVEAIRKNHTYGDYVQEQYLEPKVKSTPRKLNKRGLDFVQGTIQIDPFFTDEQLKAMEVI